MSDEHQAFEARIQALLAQGKANEAATEVIEQYGTALLHFLASMSQGDVQAGEDVFQMVCCKIWERLPEFKWGQGSLRAWAFVVARHTFLNHRRNQQRKREDRWADGVDAIPMRLSRTLTKEWLKTEVKSRLWDSIETLPSDDRTLLMLRLYQKMRWTEIARVLHDGDGELDPTTLKRSAATARKRFERLKTTLRDHMNTVE